MLTLNWSCRLVGGGLCSSREIHLVVSGSVNVFRLIGVSHGLFGAVRGATQEEEDGEVPRVKAAKGDADFQIGAGLD